MSDVKFFTGPIDYAQLRILNQPHQSHTHTSQSRYTLIELYEAWNKPEEAEKWRAKLVQTKAADE